MRTDLREVLPGRAPPPSPTPALVELEGSNDLGAITAAAGDASARVCLEPCETMCISACELRRRDVHSATQAALRLEPARPAPVASETVVELRP